MPAISRGARGNPQPLNISKWLNYTIVLAAVMFVLILIASRTGSQNEAGKTPQYHSHSIIPMADDDSFVMKQELVLDQFAANVEEAGEDENGLNNYDDFFHQNCLLEDASEWWPREEDWQSRTPFFLLIGARQAGTEYLSIWINLHPRVKPARTAELEYFLPQHFKHYDTKTSKVKVNEARQGLYESEYAVEQIEYDAAALTFEATPDYLLFSTLSRIPILCVLPWVKLLVVLRDPIERIAADYKSLAETVPKPSLDSMIKSDINLLRQADVLQDRVPMEDFAGKQSEREAWSRYQKLLSEEPSVVPIVARSLYILQLQEWYSGLREVGRDPDSEILVIRMENMIESPNDAYHAILWWLELSSLNAPSKNIPTEEEMTKGGLLSNALRRELETLLVPYNERLYKLLGWDRVWNASYQRQHAEEIKEEELEEEEEAAVEANLVMESSKQLAHFYDPPNYDEERGQQFTDKWCVLDGVSWYPPPNQDWQLRAPYFMLPGAKKSGTTALASYIMQHPLVQHSRTKELHFFNNKKFRDVYVNDERKTLVREARQYMYEMDYHSDKLKRNSTLISMDGTPGYLFYSAMLPQRILCVAPWIKLVIILRNPVDRAYSNWAYAKRISGATASFERSIEHDMNSLERSGFLGATTPQGEEKCWSEYLSLCREGLLGRSFYEIQLRQWFNAFRSVGRDPATQIHIVFSENLNEDVQGEMKKVYKFLGLPYVKVKNEDHKVVSKYSSPVEKETRQMLQTLYDPYNQKLFELLNENGFAEGLQGIWDHS
mmetsp:Transcript_12291/g.18032  ORF Transcript_12291/g.18032 Transcript_12291/m.18032 type:complete len:777 (+) Transcript_12291:59-2389(+)